MTLIDGEPLYGSDDPLFGTKAEDRDLSPKEAILLEWIVDPAPKKDKGTQGELAVRLDVNPHTLVLWKKRASFKKALESRLTELNADMERVQEVVNALFNAARNGDVKAASLYLQYTDRFVPKQKILRETDVSELSDEELAELGENITRLRDRQ